jgi:hypothetical protein
MNTCEFESAVRSKGDYGGVYEYADDVAYFYLYHLNSESGSKIKDGVQLFQGENTLVDGDVRVVWNGVEDKVGLEIKGKIWAVFDIGENKKYGGNCDLASTPEIPPLIAAEFKVVGS